MTVHNLTAGINSTYRDNPGYFASVETLRIGTRTYAVGGWDHTVKARLAYQGTLVQGPCVYTFQHATVIAANPIPDTKVYRDVEIGDHVSLAGSVYRIESAPNQNINLVRVIGREPGCGKDCRCHDGSHSCHHADPATSKPIFEPCDCPR